MCLLAHQIVEQVGTHINADNITKLTAQPHDAHISDFLAAQLQSDTDGKHQPLMCRRSEGEKYNVDPLINMQKRTLAATASVALQRKVADAFLNAMVDKVEALGGSAEVMYEKHR